MDKKRCSWVDLKSTLYIKYHDEEWGEPVHDDKVLFEFLILEGAQAGLNWLTVLKKREGYRKAFDNFDYEKVASYSDARVEELLKDEGIIRNRLKVNSAVKNARVFMEIRNEFGSFDKYLWNFVNNQPIVNVWNSINEIPTKTSESDALSKDLKKRGMNFVGSTIIYAFMQACGLVADHERKCFRSKN